MRLSTGSSTPAALCFAHSRLSVSLLSDPGLLHTCSHLRAFALADPKSPPGWLLSPCMQALAQVSPLRGALSDTSGPLPENADHPCPHPIPLTRHSLTHLILFFPHPFHYHKRSCLRICLVCLLPGPGGFRVNQTGAVPVTFIE